MKLKRLAFLALFAGAIVVSLAQRPVDALQSLRAYKEMTITFLITPSPVAYAPGHRPAVNVASIAGKPSRATLQVASATQYDAPVIVAQATPQGNIPVKFTTKPDPTAAYLKLLPNTVTLNAVYGTNTFSCPFQIFAFYTTTWKVTDWGYGTVSSGAGTFPVENYPTASYLSWAVEPDTTFTAYSNSGSPGQNTLLGAAKVSQTQCIDLTLTVPTTLAPGYYTATIQYNLYA